MTEKQTKCPKCTTTYKVSVAQLTVAQGMVCCPKCSHNFNALKNLVRIEVIEQPAPSLDNIEEHLHNDDNFHAPRELFTEEKHLLDIFERKVEQSNINLRTYLNNLNYFSTEPIDQLPSLNLADADARPKLRHNVKSYVLSSVIVVVVLTVMIYQILALKPEVIHDSSTLTSIFNKVCTVLRCDMTDERYNMIVVNKLSVQATPQNETEFSGSILNNNSKSVPVPHLLVKLQNGNQVIATHTLLPKQYLEENVSSIKRIPTNSPFRFKFNLPVNRKSFDTYSLEIVKP